MKKIFMLLAALWVSCSANAQGCLSEGITFSTQGQINSFQSNYPGCTEIEGDVTISGYTITNLNGLNVLTSIGGSLNIECNEALGSLAGLDNLTYIGENLYLAGNMVLSNLIGLQNVTYVGKDVQFTDNIALVNLAGLASLTSINGKLWIDENPDLTSLEGLNNLTSVADRVRIFSNASLVSLTGLESLAAIGGNLTIGGLGHLGGLGNPSLTNIIALGSVTSIGGIIDIGYNTVLTSLEGLDNINAGTILGLSIYNNDSLYDCEVASICTYLSSPVGSVYISDNAPGCNSLEELEEGCLLISLDKSGEYNTVSLHPNPSSGYLVIETPMGTGIWHMSLLDPGGRELMRNAITGSASQIDLAGLPPGVYFVRISIDRSVITKKIIKH